MIYPETKRDISGLDTPAHQPLISVVMGTYNGEKYLKQQLESIFKQTHQNLEVIVCDDCSSDRTVEILKEYSREHALTYLVNKTNLGLVKNYETVLSLANGDYIALADQDDIWYPGKIEVLLKNIGSASLIHSAVHVIDGTGKPHPDAFVVSEYSRDHSEKVNFTDFLETAWMLGCTSLIEKDLLDKCLPFPEGVMFHDWWLTMAAIKLGRGIKYIHEPTIQYRQYGENTAFKFFMDVTWHKRRFEFYKLLASRFNDLLSPEEKHELAVITRKNAVQFILTGIQRNQGELVEQFLQDNQDLFSLPFIREMITAVSANVEKQRGGGVPNQTNSSDSDDDLAYQIIFKLRNTLYAPVSRTDRFVSRLYRKIFRPLIWIPMRNLYRRIRPKGRQ